MAGRPFICPPGTPWAERLLRWARWYGARDAPLQTRLYMLRRMLAEVPLTPEGEAEVRRIYDLAARNGQEVDHIHELADGGLHVPHNLRRISVAEHAAKTRGRDKNLTLLKGDPLEGQIDLFARIETYER